MEHVVADTVRCGGSRGSGIGAAFHPSGRETVYQIHRQVHLHGRSRIHGRRSSVFC